MPWASKISESIQILYSDPVYLAKKEKHKLPPLERALRIRLKMYRWNATKAKREWALSDEQARAFFVAPCHYCRHTPEPTKLNGIDRREAAVGYTVENSLPCCWTCNRNKGAMGYSEFLGWVERVYKNHGIKS